MGGRGARAELLYYSIGKRNDIIAAATSKKEYKVVDDMKKDVKAALEKRFGKINSNRVILTNERLKHIKKRHPKEAALVQKHKRKVIRKPDKIYEDAKEKDTALFVKKVSKSNISLVVILQVNQKIIIKIQLSADLSDGQTDLTTKRDLSRYNR